MRELFVPPGHFYSPIVDQQEAALALELARSAPDPAGIELNDEIQLSTLSAIAEAMKECDFPEEKRDQNRYYYRNDQYSYGDAIIYQAFLRHFRPAQLIEVGSGYSSCVALDTRDRYCFPQRMTFIEPYPQRLHSLLRENDASSVRIITQKVQTVDAELFRNLGCGDMLFIDSSHVAKTGSDLCYLVFEALPRLAPGVIVHFHDCFWPFEYPERWAVEEMRSWNELYVVRAFLMFNKKFKMLFFNDYMAKKFPGDCSKASSLFMKNPGGGCGSRWGIEP